MRHRGQAVSSALQPTWAFSRIGLIVTGEGEEKFLPRLLRSIEGGGHCSFKVLRRFGQLRPRTSSQKLATMKIKGKKIATRDEEIGLEARSALRGGYHFVILVDDLERCSPDPVYRRYRDALDTMLTAEERRRAAVHFLQNMLEAYYFADAKAVNAVLGTALADHPADVEEIPHPKQELKVLTGGVFDEVTHGERIAANLDVPHVLANPETCASLRALVAWCAKAIGEPAGAMYCLDTGAHAIVTGRQLALLP
jgi:hypothetical protein